MEFSQTLSSPLECFSDIIQDPMAVSGSGLFCLAHSIVLMSMLMHSSEKMEQWVKPPCFGITTHGQWPTARPHGQAEGQWKHGLLKE